MARAGILFSTVIATLAVSYFLGALRSIGFGSSWQLLLTGTVIVAIFVVGESFLAAVVMSAHLRLIVRCAIVVIVGSVFIVETWCQVEEAAFRDEARWTCGRSYSRARWAPYSWHGLTYRDGRFESHD